MLRVSGFEITSVKSCVWADVIAAVAGRTRLSMLSLIDFDQDSDALVVLRRCRRFCGRRRCREKIYIVCPPARDLPSERVCGSAFDTQRRFLARKLKPQRVFHGESFNEVCVARGQDEPFFFNTQLCERFRIHVRALHGDINPEYVKTFATPASTPSPTPVATRQDVNANRVSGVPDIFWLLSDPHMRWSFAGNSMFLQIWPTCICACRVTPSAIDIS